MQPWASLAVMGIKTIETCGWQTTHRGHLLIHASKGKAGSIFADKPFIKKHIPDFKNLPFGAIIGMVLLTEVVQTAALWHSRETINNLTLEDNAFGGSEQGRYAWLFEEAIEFAVPFSARGSIHVWNCPPHTEQEIIQLISNK